MAHTHIGPEDRAVIARLLKARYSFRAIAEAIGKRHTSVSRHVTEYGGRDGYGAREVRRRKRMKRLSAMQSIRILKGSLVHKVVKLLKEHQSPEQIEGVLGCVSASTIYRYVHERAPHLRQFLRQTKGRYRRRRGTKMREEARERAKKRRIDERELGSGTIF